MIQQVTLKLLSRDKALYPIFTICTKFQKELESMCTPQPERSIGAHKDN